MKNNVQYTSIMTDDQKSMCLSAIATGFDLTSDELATALDRFNGMRDESNKGFDNALREFHQHCKDQVDIRAIQ